MAGGYGPVAAENAIAVLLGVVDVAGGDHAAPVGEHDVDALLGERLHAVVPLDRLLAGDGQGTELAGLDLLAVLTGTGDAGVDLAAEQCGDGLATTVVGDVVEVVARQARGLVDQAGEDVVGTAGGAARDGDVLAVGGDVVECAGRRVVVG